MAVRLSKRQKIIKDKVNTAKIYSFHDAISVLQSLPKVKFNESVDVAINLGLDPKKSDQMVRGATMLPSGTGKNVKVAVFAQGRNAELALNAGADRVGMADLAQEIKGLNFDYDVIIASADAMGIVGALGPILGPRGLMPNPKLGTVTTDVDLAVRNAKGGQVRYRTDKNSILHCAIGRIDFTIDNLKLNLQALLVDINKLKPSHSKGVYLKKISISTTMGPGIAIDMAGLL